MYIGSFTLAFENGRPEWAAFNLLFLFSFFFPLLSLDLQFFGATQSESQASFTLADFTIHLGVGLFPFNKA